MADGIKISALTEATDAQTVDGNLLETAVVDTSSSTGFSSKKTPFSRLAQYVLNKYTGLSLGGSARTVKTAIDALQTSVDKKADSDGEYDNLVVGTSKQLLSDTYMEDFTPYKFRRSPYTDRMSESIVGCSVAWNQLADNAHPPTSRNGMTIQATDGGFTINGTASASTSASSWFQLGGNDESYLSMSGHKVLVAINLLSGTATAAEGATYAIRFRLASGTDYVYLRTPQIVAPTLTSSSSASLGISNRAVFTNAKFSILVFDLTQMFGSTVADALYNMGDDGIKLFRSWYPNPYYAYSAPTMEHVSGLEAHDMVGFNQWDEEWELGTLNAQGQNVNNATRIRSKNYIPVISGATYYCQSSHISAASVWCEAFDEDKKILSTAFDGTYYKNINRVEFVIPAAAKYIRFVEYNVSTYSNDICINLSDPTRNGTYKPYESHSYVLDSSLTLRGVLKYDSSKGIYADGDTYEADGTVTRRYGIVDLGTLTWSYNSDRQFFSTDTVPNRMSGSLNLLTAKYTTGTQTGQANISDKMITSGTNVTSIVVRDSAYTDASSFKAALSGVYLVYELATPTTESAEPFEAIQITDGTEEYVSECLAPVGHESKYYENLRSKIEGLPTDLSAIICATEATNKASKNYAVGDYLIYNNTLYKVTTAIAANATLTVGTNIAATTIMAEIKALQ